MLYVEFSINSEVVAVHEERPQTGARIGVLIECRWDWRSRAFADVEELAAKVTKFTGKTHVAVDAGEHVTPRYDIIKMFEVGDLVSYGFNGDWYPCGKIAAISPSLKVISTTDGSRFHRKGQSAAWKKDGRTWTLARGVIDERNPSF